MGGKFAFSGDWADHYQPVRAEHYHNLYIIFFDSNNSLFDVGDYYNGVYNVSAGVDVPAAADVFYILNFDDILRSFGEDMYIQ